MVTKSGNIIAVFLIFEILFLVFMYMSTFYTDFRVIVTGKSVKSRKDAMAKGYGFYSDPDFGECFSETGNCDTNGYRILSWRCVPNYTNGSADGMGCMTSDGTITYNTIMEEQPCKKQCFTSSVTAEENVVMNSQGIVSSVGTHNIIQKSNGIDVSDVYIGDFDQGEMAYELKRCIPSTGIYGTGKNSSDLQGYSVNKYDCIAGSYEGINGCEYMCGSDQTLSTNSVSSRQEEEFTGVIPYPFYITTSDGEEKKNYYCNDIQNNNSVEILNHGKTVPDSFILPQLCYNHSNLFTPPSQSVTIPQTTGTYWKNDPYLYTTVTENILEQYFRLDYNMLSDPYSYVKLITNNEVRLLSKYYRGKNGVQSMMVTDETEGINISYVPFRKKDFTREEIDGTEQISIGPYNNIPLIKNIPGRNESSIVEGDDYIFVPFDIKNAFSFGSPQSGTYVFDASTQTIKLYSSSFVQGEKIYMYLRFDNDPYFPTFQPAQVDTDIKNIVLEPLSDGSGLYGQEESYPSNSQGVFEYYTIPQDDYIVSINEKTFTTGLQRFPVTGNLFVDSFSESQLVQAYLIKDVSPDAVFYIYGTPLSGFVDQPETGFYYPLYLSRVDDINYTEFKFTGYQGITFYMPSSNKNIGKKYVSMNIPSFEYLRGRAIIRTRYNSIPLDTNGISANYLYGPEVVTNGNEYSNDIYYRLETRNIFTRPIQLRENFSILETSRSGFSEFEGINFNILVSDQIRNSVLEGENGYDLTIFPQKMIQIEYDYRKFMGPYTGDMENFICVDSTNAPLPDGTIVKFGVGETISALVPNSNFNTITDSTCGSVKLENGSLCNTKRDPDVFDLSKNCITFNPLNNYVPIKSFLESGYLLSEENELFCLDENGKKLEDKNCIRPFLTDYWSEGKIYDVNEELIVNMGNTKMYISKISQNSDLPQTESWEEVSQIENIFFNTGQLLGEPETWETTIPGDIFMKPNWSLEYITALKYRTDLEYARTKGYEIYDFNIFKDRYNFRTPYLESKTIQTKFYFMNKDLSQPIVKIVPQITLSKTVFLDENYLNPLIWLMGSSNFLINHTDDTIPKFSDLQNISFALVDGNLDNFNNTQKNVSTELQLFNNQTKSDLTGYYCYFMPMIADNNHTQGFPFSRQWIRYIYNRMIEGDETDQPCKFEVVYVKKMIVQEETGPTSIEFDRNITQVPSSELFSFIDINDDNVSGQFGLFLPFSKTGPYPRVNSSVPFQISLDIPSGYTGFISIIGSGGGGEINIMDSDGYSFFGYGITGFSVRENVTNPSYEDMIQYEPSPGRTSCMSYIQHIRVKENIVYINEARLDDENRVFNVGETVSFGGYSFTVFGVDVILDVEGENYNYEHFDYSCTPTSEDFYQNYIDNISFQNYISYKDDRILPKRCISDKTGFVLNQRFDYNKTNNTYLTLSDYSDPSVAVSERVVTNLSSVVFFKPGSDDDQNRFLNVFNTGNAVLMKLEILPLEGSTIRVSNITGKATGKMSLVKSDSYYDLIRGKSVIDKFTVDGKTILTGDVRYIKNGYSFGKNNSQLATVKLYSKTYTPEPERYRDVDKKYIENEMILFKDYQTKITYRNSSDSPQKFDPNNVNTVIWSNNGKVHPQVDYKLYHDDQIFAKDDLVKYSNKLWKALKNIGIPLPEETRDPPDQTNDDWSIFSPSGDLFSQLNEFTAVLGNISFDTPAYIEQKIISVGDTHFFPDNKYYFNRTYQFDFSSSKLIYFSSDGSILDDNYNWINGNFIAEIRYYFEETEVSRSRYISEYEKRNDRKIRLTVKRSSSSMLTLEGILNTSTISYGTDITTNGGTLSLYNNNDEISQNIIISNDLDNQNVPIRISDYGKYGNCLTSCIKNIDEGQWGSESYGYIDLISSGLISTWFNDQIFGYFSEDDGSFISLPSAKCRSAVPIGDRYLSSCYTSSTDNVNYSDYLYRIPNLTSDDYGVPFCTSSDNFKFANAILLYFVPLDIDSQNFLTYEVISSSIINSDSFFSKSGYTINSGFFGEEEVYTPLSGDLNISERKTYITDGSFESGLRPGDLFYLEDTESNEITLQVDKIGIKLKDVEIDMDINNFDYCWCSDSGGKIWFYGFIYNSSGDNFMTSDIYKLGCYDSLGELVPKNLTLYVSSGSMIVEILNQPYGIEKFTLTKGDNFDITTDTREFSSQNLSVNVFVENGRIYQQGDVNYTGSATTGKKVYYKYKGDECLCKIYANSNGENGYLSYLESDKMSDLSGNSYIPIFYNSDKKGILESQTRDVTILSGDLPIERENFIDTFIIKNGTINPNPIQKPFNLTSFSDFYPDVIGSGFGIVSSTTSSNLYVTPLSDFTLEKLTTTTDFFTFLEGDTISSVMDNQTLINSMLRLNKIRPNYPDDKRECNIFLEKTVLSSTQASYDVVMDKFGFLNLKDGSSEINMYSNNSLCLLQNTKPRYPLVFTVNGKNITSEKTEYDKEQFLTILYYLDNFPVDREVYSNQENLDSAENVRIDILYETKLDSDTQPVNTEITLGDITKFSINILDNRK